MRRAAVFEEKNSLPRAELHPAIDNRDCFARAREHHPNMRRAVVGTFVVMFVVPAFRHQFFHKPLQVASRRRCGVLHQREAATGMLDENRDRPVAHTALVDLFLNRVRDLVGAFSVRANLNSIVMNNHVF